MVVIVDGVDTRTWIERNFLCCNGTFEEIFADQPTGYSGLPDLWIVFPIAVIIYFIRRLFERFVFKPLGAARGMFPRKPLPPNVPLEAAFVLSKGKLTAPTIKELSLSLNMPVRDVERWVHKKKLSLQPNKLGKFQEAAWRLTYYTASFVLGLVVLWDKVWFLDPEQSWVGHPHQKFTMDVLWFYYLQLGCYVALLFTQFIDVRRKDFWEMFIHHIATIGLMVLSYATAMLRIGTLILIIHDAADIFLESAKLCNYAKFNRLCDMLFTTFAVVFFITRLYLYPVYILKSVWVDVYKYSGPVEVLHWTFKIMLGTLQVLHVIWFATIAKMVYKALVAGKVEKDDRSDDEESDDQDPAAGKKD